MSKIWHPQDIGVYKEWVNSIVVESEESLTEWELNFINSIEGQLSQGRILSQKQAEILERIYAEKTK